MPTLARLTWIIIWLCARETVFSALKIIWTAGLLPAVKDAAPSLHSAQLVRHEAAKLRKPYRTAVAEKFESGRCSTVRGLSWA